MNQQEKVLRHLRAVGSISGLEAHDLYRIRDLPKRVSQLRQGDGAILAPHEAIHVEYRKDHLGQRYARYSLVREVAA